MRLAIFCLVAAGLAAQDSLPRATELSRTAAAAQDPAIDYYDAMSDYFRQSPRAIQAINKKGVPDQEIPAVLLIARRSSASPNQIVEARKANEDWASIATKHKVTLEGKDFVREANIVFLSEYHGRPAEQVRAMLDKGATYVVVNQELRRGGKPMPRATERPADAKPR